MGKSNGRVAMSKTAELFLLRLAREASVKAPNQPLHLFSKYIDPPQRAECGSVAYLERTSKQSRA